MNNKKQIVIIGTSAAGMAAATKLRTLDKECAITCITAESVLPYNRCLLADYLAGLKTEQDLFTKDLSFFEQNTILFKPNSQVTDLCLSEKKITLNHKEICYYDQLFIGTGRQIKSMPLLEKSPDGVFPFYDLNHALAIRDFIKKNKIRHAVIIGGGLTGLECATALNHHGIGSSIIEKNNQILSNQIGHAGAHFLTIHAQKNNCSVYINASFVNYLQKNNRVTSIIIEQKGLVRKIPCELLIVTVGAKIASQFAQRAGIACHNNGIIVNEYMQTSDPHVFAGGDVCQVKDLLTGELVQSSLWPDAVMQGISAAHSMCGLSKPYTGTASITGSHLFGLQFVTAGNFYNFNNKSTQFVVKEIITDQEYHHEYIYEKKESIKKLIGFALYGNITNLGALRQALFSVS